MRIILLLLAFMTFVSCKKKKVKDQGCTLPATELKFNGGYLSIPNIMTPNGDGFADVLFLNMDGISQFELQILEKNGKEVFSTSSNNEFWDGSFNGKVKTDLYNYSFSGASNNGENIYETGKIVVISSEFNGCIENFEKCVFYSQWNGNEFVSNQNSEFIDLSCN